jgi:predicted nuclease with TOPRIM domain
MRQVSENEFYAYISEYDYYIECNEELKVKNAPYNEYFDIKQNHTDRLLGRISEFFLNHELKYVYEIQEVRTMTEIIINKERHECPPAVAAYIKELKKENARLEESFQKATGVIAATDCEECKNKVYRKAYNDVMKIRANIQDIIEDVCKKDGDTDEFCGECGAKMDLKDGESE